MLLEFSLANYRSFKTEQKFSMLVDSDKHNLDPTFEMKTADGKKIRLVKSAILYGSNASGKSNFIRALFTLKKLIMYSGDWKIGELIEDYEPFRFDMNSSAKPTIFKIEFIGPNNIVYLYHLEYNGQEIIFESLDFKPKGQRANLFTRSNLHTKEHPDFHLIEPGGALEEKRNLKKTVIKNQLFLSVFGSEPHPQLTPIYKYFSDWDVWNVSEIGRVQFLKRQVIQDLTQPESERLKLRLGKLLNIADTKIEGITLRESSERDFKFPEKFPEDLKRKIIEDNRIQIFARHKLYENGVSKSEIEQDFENESVGTNVLLALGGLILKKLDQGGLIVFDELDNSLHPRLVQFLIKLFNHPVANQKNAQIVCASHEVLLLDRGIFRKDQIWITDKDRFGASELSRVSDFEGVREDTPLEKWYMAGKFGGTPSIKELEFIFDDHA